MTNGANQAYAACLLATCDPGDEVVLFQPYYFSHLVAAQLLGLSVLTLPCSPDGQPDPEALRAALRRPGAPISPLISPISPLHLTISPYISAVQAPACAQSPW